MSLNEKRTKRRLNRLKGMAAKLSKEYHGKEREYTFHAGYDLGYLQGKIAVLEEVLDES